MDRSVVWKKIFPISFTGEMKKERKKRGLDAEEKPSAWERFNSRLKKFLRFLSYDIWRQNPETLSSKKNILYDTTKTVILTVRNVQEMDMGASARSLTYRTVLSIVPLLAVIFAIARGFGFQNLMESSLFNFILGNVPATEKVVSDVSQDVDNHLVIVADAMDTDTLTQAADTTHSLSGEVLKIEMQEVTAESKIRQFTNLLFQLIDNSLEEAKGGGLFAGIGILLFLYTIIILFADIENNLNKIWQVPKQRSMARKVINYLAFVLLMPIFFILVNALNFISYPQSNTLKIIYILYPLVPRLLNIVPFVIIVLLFTLLYLFVPNTRVRFSNALIAGVVAGTAFHFFQMLYLSGQLWITRYNAIYGTFAAIPLLLLWIQMSWFIALIGAELSFAAQNVRKFSFEKETRNISRRYRDFFTLVIASEIVYRFREEMPPLTADQLSLRCKVPVRLTNDILQELLALKMVSVTPSTGDERMLAFQPAFDINQMTVNRLIAALDERGSEDFMIEVDEDVHWEALMNTRNYEGKGGMLLKDL